MDVLLGCIPPYWHDFIRGARRGVGHRLYPESEPIPARPWGPRDRNPCFEVGDDDCGQQLDAGGDKGAIGFPA